MTAIKSATSRFSARWYWFGYSLVAAIVVLGLSPAGRTAIVKASLENTPNNPSAVTPPVAPTTPAESSQPSKDWLKRQSKKIILMDILAITTILFLFLILLTLLRMFRHHRRRLKLDKKAPPTPYEDTWSKYRLDDDPMPRDKS